MNRNLSKHSIYQLYILLPAFLQDLLKRVVSRGKFSLRQIRPLAISSLHTISLGKQVRFGKYSLLRWSIEIGDYSFFWFACCLDGCGNGVLKIGKYCSVAGNVSILWGMHHNYTKFTMHPATQRFIKGESCNAGWSIEIGHDVRLWVNVVVLPNVKIWTWAVVGASSVVTKDIPPYAIAVGNPAKIIKYRFDAETIKKLLESKRRNRDIEKIKTNYNLEFINN